MKTSSQAQAQLTHAHMNTQHRPTHTLTFPLNKLKLVCSKTSKIIKIFSLIHAHRIHIQTHTHWHTDIHTHTDAHSHININKCKQPQQQRWWRVSSFLVNWLNIKHKSKAQATSAQRRGHNDANGSGGGDSVVKLFGLVMLLVCTHTYTHTHAYVCTWKQAKHSNRRRHMAARAPLVCDGDEPRERVPRGAREHKRAREQSREVALFVCRQLRGGNSSQLALSHAIALPCCTYVCVYVWVLCWCV